MGDPAVQVEYAEDWETLQRLVSRDMWNDDIDRHRSTEVFRGQSNRDYVLETSLQRFVGDSGEWHLETHLLRNFNKYAQQYIEEPRTVQHLVSLAQHHGLPTRLIDWSYSPLVAAFFATGGNPDADGELLVVDYAEVHEHLPEPMQNVLERANTEMFDIDLLHEMERKTFSQLTNSDVTEIRPGSLEAFELREAIRELVDQRPEPFSVFFEAPPIDHRIANQSALFSGWYPADPSRPMDDWLETHPELFRRVVVPADRKREFRDKLDQANINHRTLFPGLDGLATWLADYYRPAERNWPPRGPAHEHRSPSSN